MTGQAGAPASTLSENLARAVAAVRKRRRLHLTEMEERLRNLGTPIPRQGLMKLERAERRVDLDEVVALARVLDVPPLTLLFPIGRAEPTQVLPGHHLDAWSAAKWFCGDAHLDDGEQSAEAADVARFREHDRLVETIRQAVDDLDLLGTDRDREYRRRLATRSLNAVRAEIRRRGLTPPPADDIAGVDE